MQKKKSENKVLMDIKNIIPGIKTITQMCWEISFQKSLSQKYKNNRDEKLEKIKLGNP